MALRFVWDPEKAIQNSQKHGATFEEASTVFNDPLAGSFHDPDHSDDEDRYITIGRSVQDRLVIVSHTYPDEGDIIRIISARQPTARERKAYEEVD